MRERENHADLERAIANTEGLIRLGSALGEAAVAAHARKMGRTVEAQWRRMGDGYTYQAAEQDPHQRQLDEYAAPGGEGDE